ncbi:MAG: CCA tRNA nucleotidyltransferase, partial [Terriglobales bacterium]
VGKPPTFRRAPDRIRFDRHAAIGARMAARIAARLRLPGAEAAQVEALVADHMKFLELGRMRESTRKRFLREPGMEQRLELLRLDCTMSHGDLSLYHQARDLMAQLRPEEIRPPKLVTGDDLIAMGYAPGPQFRRILDAVEDAQLEGQLADAEAARRFVSRHYPVAN